MSKMQGQVYIFDFGDKIKVGFSTDVQKRLRTIELSSGVKAKQVYAVDGSREIESIIHSWLDNRLEGEFFAVPFDTAKGLLNDAIQGLITKKHKKVIKKTSSAVKNKYNDKTYDRINLTVYKGEKEIIKAHADKYDNGSVNGFIQRAIKETIERDNEKTE